ncbi:Mog1p/PsbP-like protein [Exidia glandulosa HHB12029]|uniref:Mog1p/PsbP-like protein n=1 Tax=Exidia glandulosa HHB12029 TaxID=1314781 RepID=A0A165GF42_EXIGL|nr:Mog1p/PsbP-like protein [Exidia glandulosa HHB12029]
MELAKRDLFGGAMTVNLPRHNLVDASTLREVPDTQEVFLHTDCTASWIVEILQRVEPVDAVEAAKFHFSSLAHDNDALSSQVVDVRTLPAQPNASPHAANTPPPTICDGWQEVAKYNRTAPDKVEIMLAVYRLQAQNIDVVLSVNLPHVLADGTRTPEDLITGIKSSFVAVAQSLSIVDFGLFA